MNGARRIKMVQKYTFIDRTETKWGVFPSMGNVSARGGTETLDPLTSFEIAKLRFQVLWAHSRGSIKVDLSLHSHSTVHRLLTTEVRWIKHSSHHAGCHHWLPPSHSSKHKPKPKRHPQCLFALRSVVWCAVVHVLNNSRNPLNSTLHTYLESPLHHNRPGQLAIILSQSGL